MSLNVTPKQWFTLIAMVERIAGDLSILHARQEYLIGILISSGGISEENARELEALTKEVVAVTDHNSECNVETASEVVLTDTGTINTRKTLTDNLDSDFTQLVENALFELNKE